MKIVFVLWIIFLAQVVKEWFVGDLLLVKIGLSLIFVIALFVTSALWYSIQVTGIPEYLEGLISYDLVILLVVGIIVVLAGLFLAHDVSMSVVGLTMVVIPLIKLAPEINHTKV